MRAKKLRKVSDPIKHNYWAYPGIKGNVNIPQFVIDTVCHITGVSFDMIKSKSRMQHVIDAKYLMVFFIHKKFKTQYSLRGIATMINLTSHATALHAIRRATDLRECNIDFRDLFEKIERQLA